MYQHPITVLAVYFNNYLYTLYIYCQVLLALLLPYHYQRLCTQNADDKIA
jgi:hypothetical protein